MTLVSSRPPVCGAILAIAGGGRDPGRLIADGFKEDQLERFVDRGLAIAWTASDEHDVYISEKIVCLVEGALYEPVGRSPAAALAEAYQRAGEDAFVQARGEYWALLWKRVAGEGLLVTDHMGSRAPYWFSDGTGLIAGSEVSGLLDVLPQRPAPDPLALAHWLMITAAPEGATLFTGIRRLQAGQLLPLGRVGAVPRRYWSPAYGASLRAPRAELAERVRDVLARATSRRIGDAGRTGVLLSGGLDSSVVAAFASREAAHLNSYSAIFPEHPQIDESSLIEQTVERLGLRSTRLAVRSGSVLTGAMSYVNAWQLPPTSPNLFFWAPLLECAAADGVRVMLDGEGGDELFGFSPYLLADRLRRGRLVSTVRLTRRWPSSYEPTFRRLAYRLMRFGVAGAVPPGVHTTARRVRGMDRYLTPWMPPALGRAWLESEESAFAWKRIDGPRWWTFLCDAVTRGVGPALVYEQSRRRAALVGLDARHPLVDVDVIELALRIAPEVAFDPRFSRPLLRESVAGMLPDEVRLRPEKSSFDSLFHGLLAGPELPLARELLEVGEAELGAYIDMAAVNRVLLAVDPPPDNPWRSNWALRLWRLLTAELWLRAQRDQGFFTRFAEDHGLPAAAHEFVSRG